MRAVAKEVGCQSPSLYHYFKSKDDIFRALVDAGMALFEQFLPASGDLDPLTQLWWRYWRYYEFSKAHPEYFRLLFVERSSPLGDPTLHERVLGGAATRACLDTCLRAGLLPPQTDPATTASVLLCAIHGAAVLGMRGASTLPQQDALARRTLKLAIEGARAGLLHPVGAAVPAVDDAPHPKLASCPGTEPEELQLWPEPTSALAASR